jgi:4-hydroxythreonine-4-phosphate dehydrogenase
LARTDVLVGITIGDPAGIGPEVALKAAVELHGAHVMPVVIGRNEVLRRYYAEYLGPFTVVKSLDPQEFKAAPGTCYIYDVELSLPVPRPGGRSPETGLESKTYIDTAIRLWREKHIDAIVTGPVSKEMIATPGLHFTGHTEYLAECIGEDHPGMMMYSPEYRVLLATTHCPLEKVRGSIDADVLLRAIQMGHRAIAGIDGAVGKIKMAIAGLDPHCGDGGAIGTFDSEVTARVVKRARDLGIDIEGPYSADTLFLPDRWRRYNLVIAQYHDQGLIPFKMLAFDTGVNITVGLSLVRTSVDHGTAFDIAGKGIASHSSMKEAIVLAGRLAASAG